MDSAGILTKEMGDVVMGDAVEGSGTTTVCSK